MSWIRRIFNYSYTISRRTYTGCTRHEGICARARRATCFVSTGVISSANNVSLLGSRGGNQAARGGEDGGQDEKGNRHRTGKEERKYRKDDGKEGGNDEGRGEGRKECNVTADKVSIAGLSAASMIRASYNESRGEWLIGWLVSQYTGARQGIFTSFWTIMLILIADVGRGIHRRDENVRARRRINFDLVKRSLLAQKNIRNRINK